MKFQTTFGVLDQTDMVGMSFMYRGHKFMARQIQRFMRIEKRKADLPELEEIHDVDFQQFICNHGGKFTEQDGVLCVAEALKRLTIHPFLEAYPEKTWDDLLLYRPKLTNTILPYEKGYVIGFCKGAEGKPYEVSNFWFNMKMILGQGEWKGQEHGNKYWCTEFLADVDDELWGLWDGEPWLAMPYYVQINRNYDVGRIIKVIE